MKIEESYINYIGLLGFILERDILCIYRELDETVGRLQDVEVDKRELHAQTEALQLNLQVMCFLK